MISDGDCLWDLAEQYQVTVEDLLAANSHNSSLQSDPMLLFPGDSLALPRHARRIPKALRGIRGATAVTRFSRPRHQGRGSAVATPGQPGSNGSEAAQPLASAPALREREGAPAVCRETEAREGGVGLRGEERGGRRGEGMPEEDWEEGYSLHLKDTYPGASSFFRVFPRAQGELRNRPNLCFKSSCSRF